MALVTVFDSKGQSFTVDDSTLDKSRPYAQQIPGSADYISSTSSGLSFGGQSTLGLTSGGGGTGGLQYVSGVGLGAGYYPGQTNTQGTNGGNAPTGALADLMKAQGYTWDGTQWVQAGGGGGAGSTPQMYTDPTTGVTFYWDTESSSYKPLSSGYFPSGSASTTYTNPSGTNSYTDADGYVWTWDSQQGQYVRTGYSGTSSLTGMSDAQKAAQDLAQQQFAWQQQQDTASQAYQQQQLQLQQQQLQYQQQQDAASLAAEKQKYLAQLKANPGSWLEYAAASGTSPVIQPWMLPLMPQQYGTVVAGANIPGWNGSANSASGMPDLINPSAQYLARISPSAKEQYYGYQQADTGATPSDTQWKLWSAAPPSGGNTGLTYTR